MPHNCQLDKPSIYEVTKYCRDRRQSNLKWTNAIYFSQWLPRVTRSMNCWIWRSALRRSEPSILTSYIACCTPFFLILISAKFVFTSTALTFSGRCSPALTTENQLGARANPRQLSKVGLHVQSYYTAPVWRVCILKRVIHHAYLKWGGNGGNRSRTPCPCGEIN